MTNVFGTKDFFTQPVVSTKGKQIAYLKEHEQEIVDFVKSQNSKIETVQIDWSDIRWGEAGNGTPQGGGKYIALYGTINNLSESSWSLDISIKDEMPDLNEMGITNGIRLEGEYFE